RHSLDEALEIYRTTFSQEKESFRQRAEELSTRGVAHAAELAGEPGLIRARVLAGAEIVDERELDPADRARMREAPPHLAELPGSRARLEYLQKVSAWQEVARRLAHEIKNPLTPIQLAVQQLQSKYPGDDPAYRSLLATAREILDEEVGSIRRLVDDFSAF